MQNNPVKQSDGNQHRKKKLPLLIAKAINSLPHKSAAFVPQCVLIEPSDGNQYVENRSGTPMQLNPPY